MLIFPLSYELVRFFGKTRDILKKRDINTVSNRLTENTENV